MVKSVVVLVAFLAVVAAVAIPVLPQQFTAKVQISSSLDPSPSAGVLSYDYVNNRTRFDQTAFGVTETQLTLYNISTQYGFEGSGTHIVSCSACLIDPPMFPIFVPSYATNAGTKKIGNITVDVWTAELTTFALNMTFWVDSTGSPPSLVLAKFTVESISFGVPAITTTYNFTNVKPGPPSPALFVAPTRCPAPKCDSQVDLLFLIDGSGSISAGDFALEKKFVLSVINSFVVAPNKASVAAIQFASTTRTLTPFSTNMYNLIYAINTTAQLGGGTNTAAAVDAATSMFEESPQFIPDALIILTDGGANEGSDPVAAANRAKTAGIEVYCVGIGSQINAAQLQAMASEPIGIHYYTASSFSALPAILNTLVSTTCSSSSDCY
jgi:hypothetical protein